MAKLSEIQGRSFAAGGGAAYMRCFGDPELSVLLSRVQSLIIRNGFELERLIADIMKDSLIGDLDDFLSYQIMDPGVRMATKKTVKAAKTVAGNQIEPDFMVFERTGPTQRCYIIELKDGHEFDTKSSAKEQANLEQFLAMNAAPLQFYHTYGKICGFNARTREEIQVGFKGRIDIEEAMTGLEFCQLIGVDYQRIVDIRANDRQANFAQFLDELMNIDSIRNGVTERLGR